VGVSLPETTTVRLVDQSRWDYESIPREDRDSIAAVVARLRELVPEIDTAGACSVRAESDVPRAAGFGSSAALCTAFARAVCAHTRRAGRLSAGGTGADADPLSEWRLAHELEKIFHGTPSGIDTGLSIREGTWAFQPRPPDLPAFEHLPCALPTLVIAAVPRDESCGALVADLSRRLKAGDKGVLHSIDSLGNMAGTARDALRGRTTDAARLLADLADRAMAVLRGLGLSVPGLDALLDAGKAAGALGGKLSGAGGGGAFYLVAPGTREARQIAQHILEEASRGGIRLASPPRVLGSTREP
jgi:mevalonate kinase